MAQFSSSASVSASDSTFRKSFGAQTYSSGTCTLLADKDIGHVSPALRTLDGDATSNPFDSKCSTISGGLKQASTSRPQSWASPNPATDFRSTPVTTGNEDQVIAALTPASLASMASVKCHPREHVKGKKESGVPLPVAVSLTTDAAVKLTSSVVERATIVTQEIPSGQQKKKQACFCKSRHESQMNSVSSICS